MTAAGGGCACGDVRDYVVSKTAAGDDLIALLADEIEPTVVVRRYSNGTDLLMTSFET
jgi:hypothetical protein